MIKVAILDDYQNVFEQIVNIENYKDNFDFKIFNEPFQNQEEAAVALEEFNALFLMRERTPITKSLLSDLPNIKYIMTSGMRNNSIDLEETKKRNIIVCGTEINPNPAAEITWALILGLLKNVKQEVDNMFQGYWQTTIGLELKGKMLGLVGLGKIGIQVAKIAKAFGMEVCAWSENLNLTVANELGVIPMSKEDLIKTSDIISIHVVFGERYKNLFTSKEFSIMKKNAFFYGSVPFLYQIHGAPKDYFRFTSDFFYLHLKKNKFRSIKIINLGFGPFYVFYSLMYSYISIIPFFKFPCFLICFLLDSLIQFFVKTDLKNIFPIGIFFIAKK